MNFARKVSQHRKIEKVMDESIRIFKESGEEYMRQYIKNAIQSKQISIERGNRLANAIVQQYVEVSHEIERRR